MTVCSFNLQFSFPAGASTNTPRFPPLQFSSLVSAMATIQPFTRPTPRIPAIRFFFFFFFLVNLSFRGQASAERTPPEGLVVKICIYFKIDKAEKGTDGWESRKYIEYTVLHSTMTDWRYDPRHAPNYHQTLFLSSVDSVSILTCNDLYFGGRYLLIRFHLERCIFH